MNKVEEKKTDLELAMEALAALKPLITTADRKESGYGETTVIHYLNGRGTDIGTAVELLQFFRERIEKRREIILSK